MKIESTAVQDDLQKRLRRIEGQVRGVQRMLEDERDCTEIVQQLNAVQAALRNATTMFMRGYAKQCLHDKSELSEEERLALLDNLFDLVGKVK